MMLASARPWGTLLVAAFLVTPALCQEDAPKAPPTPEEAIKDSGAIIALWEANSEALESIATMYVDVSVPFDELQAKIDEFNRVRNEVVPAVQEQLAPFAERYATERQGTFMNMPPITVYDTLWEVLGRDLNDLDDPADKFDKIYMAIERATTKAQDLAEQLAISVESDIDLVNQEFFVEDIRVSKLEDAKRLLQTAQSMDPNNEKVNAFLAAIDGLIVETQQNLDRAADEAKWTGHIADFAGPGNVNDLERQLLTYFRGNQEWSGKPGTEILAVAVRGQWAVAETNILGQVIRWRLPIHLAVTKPEWREQNLARVYDLSAVGMLGAGKTPPFDGAWVGDSWMTRITNLP